MARQIHSVLSSLLSFHGPSLAATQPEENLDRPPEYGEAEIEDTIPIGKASIVLPQLLVAGRVTPKEDLTWFLHHSPNLLIATPGRLLELLSSPHVHCAQSSFEVLVLDEADRLLDMGFKDELQKIIGRLPKQRRTGLFSATVGEAVDQIVRVGLRNPVKIAVKVRGADGKEDQRTPASLQLSYMVMAASRKFPTICQILSQLNPLPYKTIIYLSTCAAIDYWQHVLPRLLPQRDGLSFLLIPLHGKQQQKVRQKNFARFANATSPTVLLTTDVAARGLDIPQVDLVLQVDPPNDPKVFLHRCGRAGRAGRKGLSILFLQPGREEDYLAFLEIRKTPLSPFTPPKSDLSEADAEEFAARIRKQVLTDRAIHEKAQRAFVSWARAYSKHQASSIFRLQDQDWSDLGLASGLLKLPSMPELRNLSVDRSLGVTVNWSSYAYEDKIREQARQKALHDPTPTKANYASRPSKRAWSQQHDAQENRQVKRDKRQKKREHQTWEKMTPSEREKRQELDALIQQVRQQHKDEEFNGFD